ncbi:glycoside hydrolase family 43 protein [Humibacter soli]
MDDPDAYFGYLAVHFVETTEPDGEQIYFTLSDGDDPRRWTRLNRGRPVLRSTAGTCGVRDPHIVRSPIDGSFFLLATDMNARRDGWESATRTGSRAIEIWHSDDLVEWSEQHHVVVAPMEAGMAWAPEAIWDPEKASFLVHWTSSLYDDSEHTGDPHSLIMRSYTRDFVQFTPPEVWLDPAKDPTLLGGVLDSTVIRHGECYYRFIKGIVAGVDDGHGRPLGDIFAETSRDLSALQTGWRRIASGITYRTTHRQPFEGPLAFRANDESGWYLWADHFGDEEQGYQPFFTTDLDRSAWQPIPTSEFRLEPNTKHGVVLPLRGDEWQRLQARYPA